MTETNAPRERHARCGCGAFTATAVGEPVEVLACSCLNCQRESGSAFALNAMIEADRVKLVKGQPEIITVPTLSGKGQKFARCPKCRIALWSNYAGAGDAIRFVRIGTLDNPDLLPPDIHIYTASKQPWVILPPGVPAVEEYYQRSSFWPAESLERRDALVKQLATE